MSGFLTRVPEQQWGHGSDGAPHLRVRRDDEHHLRAHGARAELVR